MDKNMMQMIGKAYQLSAKHGLNDERQLIEQEEERLQNLLREEKEIGGRLVKTARDQYQEGEQLMNLNIKGGGGLQL